MPMHILSMSLSRSSGKLRIQVKSKTSSARVYATIAEHTNLDDICVIKDHRKIRNDHTFSYGNKFYLIDSPLKHSIANQKIEIRNTSKKGFTAHFAGAPALRYLKSMSQASWQSEDLAVQKKLEVLALVEKLGNVSVKLSRRTVAYLATLFTDT